MNADLIISLAPIGSIVEWSDGNPRPPEHHVATLYHWKRNNGSGLLVRKCGETGPDHPGVSPFFMLRSDDDLRTFSVGLPHRRTPEDRVGSDFREGRPDRADASPRS